MKDIDELPALIKAMTSATLSGSCGYDGETKAFCGFEAVFLRSSEGTRPIPTTITLLIPAFFI